jgi:hypothetical protein
VGARCSSGAAAVYHRLYLRQGSEEESDDLDTIVLTKKSSRKEWKREIWCDTAQLAMGVYECEHLLLNMSNQATDIDGVTRLCYNHYCPF